MNENNKNKPLLYPDHKPVTRRQLLAQGFIAYSAMTTLPGLFGLGLRKAIADGCGGAAVAANHVPFMVFDMAGGASLPANFLVGNKGGAKDLLKSYDLLGWDPREGGALYEEFGLPMSMKYSTMLKGILANTSKEARAKFRLGSFCHFGQDDSSGNQLNSSSLVLKAGIRGNYITNGLGIMKSDSGGNSALAYSDVSLRPTYVRGISDVLGATNFGGGGFAGASPERLKALANGSLDLSRLQQKSFKGNPQGDILAHLSKCAYEKSLEFVNGVAGLDPRQDANVNAVYTINAATAESDMNAVSGAIAMNAIKGTSGPGIWTLGGCDYHNGTQETGDQKDNEMGIQIGRAVELAHRLKRPLFFQLITDGGNSATPGTRKWRGDSGDKSMTVIGYYSPDAAPKYIRKDNPQVGYYTDGQGAERTTLIGGNPNLVAHAVLANYLNVSGKLKMFPEVAPGVFKNKEDLDSVLIFEGKA